ncbi:hypothetical protein V6615_10710 [Oscillospiraceae bacterium PP1C4]
MILDTVIWVVMAILGCIGFVQTVTWIAVRCSCKRNKIYRVIPIGGAGKNAGNQMSLMYTCLQWEANPSKQIYVLYDAGLDEQGIKDCEELTRAAGVLFVRTPEELAKLFTQS